jgi:hypothetical protein
MMKKVTLLLATLLFIAAGQAKPDLPPISYTCPMHADVVQDKKGACPICKMELVPVRLTTIYSCPVHSIVQEQKPGRCPIDRRELVPLTVALTFTCPEHPDINKLTPGKCPDGSAMEPKYTMRAHGNHNPQHNGIFFMAEDNWHHVEGAYPEEGLFRLYLYNDYTKPLPPDLAKRIKARVVTKETFDPATKTTKEITAYPLKLSENGEYLEAKIDRLPASKAAPAQMTAKVQFTADQKKDYVFDFAFPGLSEDKDSAIATFAATGIDPLQSIDIPDDPVQILKLLNEKTRALADFIQKRDYGQIWVPAFQSKDLALALDVRIQDLPAAERPKVTNSIEQLVRAAWLLDNYGDTGDKTQIDSAFAVFSQAAEQVQAAFAEVLKSKGAQ